MTSKWSIERRLDELEEASVTQADASWLESVPQELWSDRTAAWRYYITQDDSDSTLDVEE